MMTHCDSNSTLYVGNLDPSVTEELVVALFSHLGQVVSCKMFRDPTSDPYCFIEYLDHSTAVNALTLMNDKLLNDRRMRVDWATGQGNKKTYTKVDTSKHFHIYVGDLSPEIDEQALREAFQVFGEISDTKIVRDPQTMKSRGYGFVVFVRKADAESAISNMNGQWLGRKMIKTRWATRKPQTQLQFHEPRKLSYDEVFNQTTPTNTTVFCGGLKNDVTEETVQKYFSPFGNIEKIKIFKEKGYCFIKYSAKDNACQAIVDMHNSMISGQIVRCSWGKDTTEMQPPHPPESHSPPHPTPPTTNGQQQNYNTQVNYWQQYPQVGYNNYNQYYGYQTNPGYMWMGWGQQGYQQQQPQSNVSAPPPPLPPHSQAPPPQSQGQ